MYIRKTRDVYEIQVNYGYDYGFECVCTESTWKEGEARLKEYRENEPQYASKMVCKRERIQESV